MAKSATLSDPEAVCLDIMQTDDMLAIGNWEEPIKSLAAKGYARHVTGQFYGITPEGLKALDTFETEQMRGMVAEHNARVRQEQTQARNREIIANGGTVCTDYMKDGSIVNYTVIDGEAEEIKDGSLN
jgi:predicted transcriptional regulator